MVLMLTNDDVEQVAEMDEIVQALEEMNRELNDEVAMSTPRIDLHAPAEASDEYFRFKTAGGIVPFAGVYALRINSDVLRWVERGGTLRQEKLPRADGERWVGFVLLFDAGDGTPLAIFHDGYVQKLRVGATSAIGARRLAREESSTLGMLGAGWQAGAQVRAHAELFDLDEVTVYSPTRERRESFAEEVAEEYDVAAAAVDEPEDACRADVVQSATNARSPAFDFDWIEPGTHLGAINTQEIDPAALDGADLTVVHTKRGDTENYWTAEVDVDDVPYLGGEETSLAEYPDLPALVAGDLPGREDDEDVTFFMNNTGTGAQFAAVGRHLYDEARDADMGHTVPTELFTQSLVP